MPIVKAATAHDNPVSGTTYTLVIGQAIYLGNDVEHTLLCPNQLRSNGLIVDECPKHLALKDNPSTHSVLSPDEQVGVPLRIAGTIYVFQTRTPTAEEIETCKWVALMSDEFWDPKSERFYEEEEKLESLDPTRNKNNRDIMLLSRTLTDKNDTFDDCHFLSHSIQAVNTGMQKPTVSIEKLAQRWGIGIASAANTVQVITQKRVRNAVGHIEQRLKTKQAHSRYPQVGGRHGQFYTDTFFSSVATLRNCSCAQLYTNDIGYMKIYPMRGKRETSETLNAFFHEVGIPHEFTRTMLKNLWRANLNKSARIMVLKLHIVNPIAHGKIGQNLELEN